MIPLSALQTGPCDIVYSTCTVVVLHLRLGLQSFLTWWADLGTYDSFLVHNCYQCTILSIQLSGCEHGSCKNLIDLTLTKPKEKARPNAAAGDVIYIFY
jgi:hypothetical protein